MLLPNPLTISNITKISESPPPAPPHTAPSFPPRLPPNSPNKSVLVGWFQAAEGTDARMAPIWFGRFDLDDYIDHIRDMLDFLDAGVHVLAVCQPGPPVLAAIAMMAWIDSEGTSLIGS